MTTHHPPGVIIKNASLQYQHHLLFDQLNFELIPQQCTAILGPSGVGKSSLLRLIANLITPSTGTAIYSSGHTSLEHHISYTAQNDLLLPWANVLQNVLIGYQLRAKTNDELEAKAITLLNSVGLAKAITKYPHELSGGMRQRVALVRTLMEDKPIVLMDEPFSALDTITRLQLQTLTANLLQNKTVLLITHDPLEALRMSHTIYIMTGSPAYFYKIISVPGEPPRDPEDAELLKREGELVRLLLDSANH